MQESQQRPTTPLLPMQFPPLQSVRCTMLQLPSFAMLGIAPQDRQLLHLGRSVQVVWHLSDCGASFSQAAVVESVGRQGRINEPATFHSRIAKQRVRRRDNWGKPSEEMLGMERAENTSCITATSKWLLKYMEYYIM